MRPWMYLVLAVPFLAGCVGADWGYNRTRSVLLLVLAILLGVPVVALLWVASG